VTDWLAFCRDAAAAVERALAELPTRTDREPVVALGEGGDETTAIDAAAESAVVSLLERLHAGGVEFTLVSEELGERSFGADGVRVVLDPIDGSMNAKRGIPFFSVSIAVAEGAVMRDVFFGYVFDFGTREEWTARRGEGAFLNGERLDGPGPKEEVEMLSFEATTTELVAEQIADMVGIADRTRIMGSLALSLCHLAAGRVDGVCSLKPARSVDIAAAQLLVRERGLAIDLPDAPPFGEAPLDLAGRSRVVAAASPERCAELFARLSASDRSDAAGSTSRPATRPP
jgi:myo-inositol-1(or 4)-monophosphatase